MAMIRLLQANPLLVDSEGWETIIEILPWAKGSISKFDETTIHMKQQLKMIRGLHRGGIRADTNTAWRSDTGGYKKRDLNQLNLSGPLAPELGKLDRLQYLEIDHNRLTGPIPRELVGLSNLKHADFSNNNLCGPIPTSGAFQHIPRSSFANNPRLGRKC